VISSIITSVIIESSLSKIYIIVIGLRASFSVSGQRLNILYRAGMMHHIDQSCQSYSLSMVSGSSSSKWLSNQVENFFRQAKSFLVAKYRTDSTSVILI